jgi:hypothetical protein
VASAVPFQLTAALVAVKLLPFTVKVKAPLPAVTGFGLRLEIVGWPSTVTVMGLLLVFPSTVLSVAVTVTL